MPDRPRTAMLHISSAVVTAWPKDCAAVARRIAALPDTEVRHADGSRIIVVMEGPDSGTIGRRLAEIALMDGVLSANLVFEQAEILDIPGAK
jgi:nitrate reductase NapD